MLKEEYIALEPVDSTVLIDTITTSRRVIERDTLDYRVLMYTHIIEKQNYLIEIGRTTETITQFIKPLQKVALNVLVLLIGITLVLDLFFTRFLLRPLGKIIKSKLQNRKFPFNEQIDAVKTTTEDFRLLDKSFIALMEQINEAFEKEREFTSNASHELMTPISILQSKMENMMMAEDVGENQQERILELMRTLSRLKKIVNALLLISRIENEQFGKTNNVSPSNLIAEVIEELKERMEEKGLRCTVNLHPHHQLEGVNNDLLFQLFYNLVNNSIRYNKPGGSITIVDRIAADGRYEIIIRDTGSGIPPAELPNIFNRFKKAGRTEGEGVGLGLAIVKSILDFHGMTIQVSSRLSEGTNIVIGV
ncbi:cell wall metabolism sensor histidine kinase WalK [Flavihumibacter sp. ZG627]|uniref:sensor histidine kinase n=1 Tax=Flavihumibacter sp. ZG627 TaxID=1463156 RepID=UPI001C106C25|nr:HAMP domain-containing sensor histidine kinase [Flavihumibacter sp. ZG627]